MNTFEIHSVASDRVLTFSGRGAYWQVSLTGIGVSARTSVWAEMDNGALNQFFQALGEMQRPWQGARAWEAFESECALSAECSALGGVTLDVILRGNQGMPERWTVQAGLVLEFGQLARIASEAEMFFTMAA